MTPPDGRSRPMSDEHKAALAEGRAQGRAVRAYLEALEAHKPKRGRRRTPESMRARIEALGAEIDDADPLKRVQLIQERLDLEKALDADEDKPDLEALEKGFVDHAFRLQRAQGHHLRRLARAGRGPRHPQGRRHQARQLTTESRLPPGDVRRSRTRRNPKGSSAVRIRVPPAAARRSAQPGRRSSAVRRSESHQLRRDVRRSRTRRNPKGCRHRARFVGPSPTSCGATFGAAELDATRRVAGIKRGS